VAGRLDATDNDPASFLGLGAAGGLVYYALAFWWYLIGLQQAPASLAALFLNRIPIFGVGGAYLVLGERLTLVQWGGALLILVAVVTIVRLQHSTPPKTTSQTA
jgi:drug/metabolite transporter (DMT)-like permease